MFKFIKRTHQHKGASSGQIVITYSVSEIVIGFLLIALVGFFIYQYVKENLYPERPAYYYPNRLIPSEVINTPPAASQKPQK